MLNVFKLSVVMPSIVMLSVVGLFWFALYNQILDLGESLKKSPKTFIGLGERLVAPLQSFELF
jgi:hypothetical protein